MGAVLPDMPGVIGTEEVGIEAFGSVVGVEGIAADGGVGGGVASVACAKAPGAAASMAATALASAKRCKFVRVDMGGKAPFYKNRSQIAVAAEIDIG